MRHGSIGVRAPWARMPRLQVALQQTLRGLPTHRKRLFLLGLQATCMKLAIWIARRAVNRDPPVGIVTRSACSVVSTAAGLRSP